MSSADVQQQPVNPFPLKFGKNLRENRTASVSLLPKNVIATPSKIVKLPARNADGFRVGCGRRKEADLGFQPIVIQKDVSEGPEAFSLRLRLFTGYLLYCKCNKDWTASDFLADCADRLKTFLPSKKQYFQLQVTAEQKLAPHEILSSNVYVVECLSKGSLPTLSLIPLEHETRHDEKKLFRKETHTAPNPTKFNVQFYFPNDSKVELQCKGNDTLAKIKDELQVRALESGLSLDFSKCGFKASGTVGYILDETITLDQHSFLDRMRKRGLQPKILVVDNSSAQSKKEKKANLEIGSLMGKPLVYTADQNEITICRYHMAEARYEVAEMLRVKKSSGQYSSVPIRLTTYPPPEDPKLLVNVHLLLKQVTKTVKVEEGVTANQFRTYLFDKYYGNIVANKTAQDYVLKLAGYNEYIDGDHSVWDFELVRSILAKGERPLLVVMERPPPEGDDEFDEEYTKEVLDELLENSELKLDHREINSLSRPWYDMKFISIWEIKRCFRLKVIGAENISFANGWSMDEAGAQIYVTAGLFHGGQMISRLMTTQQCMNNLNPRWYEWVYTDISLCNIPRATRLCFTLWVRREKKEDSEKDTPLGWVNLQLFDYKHELRTGLFKLNMWPDDKANPIGTCVPNHQSNSTVFFVEFDNYPLPVAFPTVPSDEALVKASLAEKTGKGRSQKEVLDKIEELVKKDPLYSMSVQEKETLWRYRTLCVKIPKSLPKLLMSVPINDRFAVSVMHKLLESWEELSPVDALELLDARFADAKVREFAVRCLKKFGDEELIDYLLQLVQVLKYEPYHHSALGCYLLSRALQHKRIGHVFFWYLKSEMHVPEINERYGLLLEAFLRGCGKQRTELKKQDDLLKEFVRVANIIKPEKDSDRKEIMINELKKIKFPSSFQLPLDASLCSDGVIVNKCKYMDSKKLPLWLVFTNADKKGDPIYTIFKSGDDLRQDMLTLQMIRIMDKLWKKEGLDLLLSPYGCISTGNEVGMIEVVLNSQTTAQISKSAGGAAAAFREDPLANWLQVHNPGPRYEQAVSNFIYSCAGYCVATYVLGIGDRHNDNIMVTMSGKLFHIDFGHFLGNYKKKFGFKRERAPFVFTPDFAYVMKGKDSAEFNSFVELCCKAYNILRDHASMFINLFAMMLSTGIPELTSVDDIDYLREAFSLDLTPQQASQKFKALIYESLTTKTTQLNNAIHILAH